MFVRCHDVAVGEAKCHTVWVGGRSRVAVLLSLIHPPDRTLCTGTGCYQYWVLGTTSTQWPLLGRGRRLVAKGISLAVSDGSTRSTGGLVKAKESIRRGHMQIW